MDDARLDARLHAAEISAWELRVILAAHFGRIQDLEDGALAYLRDGQVALATKHTDDRVISVQTGPALTENDLGALQSAVELGVLTAAGRKVRRHIVFAIVPVEGSWSFRDLVQLLPAPDDAPRPPGPMGQNPFVLEASFADSQHPLLASERGAAAVREAHLLLSAFVPWIEGPSGWGHIELQWAIPVGRPVTRSIWTQKVYTFEGFEYVAEGFSAPGHRKLALVDERTLFARHGLMGGETLELPASLDSLFDHYYALDPVRRERVFRWAYWISHSALVSGLSISASYMAVIQAIEALRPNEDGGPACIACGRPTGPSATSKFISFMDRYAPPEDDQSETARRKLYRLRSALTHGGKLMEQDLHPGFGQFTLTWADERRATVQAATLARMAGINWLLSDGN
jgi:hypothetical protein